MPWAEAVWYHTAIQRQAQRHDDAAGVKGTVSYSYSPSASGGLHGCGVRSARYARAREQQHVCVCRRKAEVVESLEPCERRSLALPAPRPLPGTSSSDRLARQCLHRL